MCGGVLEAGVVPLVLPRALQAVDDARPIRSGRRLLHGDPVEALAIQLVQRLVKYRRIGTGFDGHFVA